MAALVAVRIAMAAVLMIWYVPDIWSHDKADRWYFSQGGNDQDLFGLSRALVDGRVGTWEMQPGGTTLGMPLLAAPVVWLRDAKSWHDVVPVLAPLNAFVLYPVTIVMLGAIGRRLTGSRTVAAATAAVWAILPYLLYATEPRGSTPGIDLRYVSMTHLMGVAVAHNQASLFLLMSVIWLALAIDIRKGGAFAVSVGVAWGLATLVRPENALLAFAVCAIAISRGRGWTIVPVSAVALSVFTPQFVYNAHWYGSPFNFGYGRLDWERLYGGPMFSPRHAVDLIAVFWKQLRLLLVPAVVVVMAGAAALWRRSRAGLGIAAAWALPLFLMMSLFLMTKWAPTVRLQPVLPIVILLVCSGLLWLESPSGVAKEISSQNDRHAAILTQQ